MAGYVIGIGSNGIDSIKSCVKAGVYSTTINVPDKWNIANEGTFADYLSMKPGDKIFFFSNRKIYGIGELVNIGDECKYWNFEKAYIPSELCKNPIVEGFGNQNRCICFFKPSPSFFISPVDMDDALLSNPDAFKMIRAFWKLSFIKIDDEETKALIDIIIKRNKDNLNETMEFNSSTHNLAKEKISNSLKMSATDFIKDLLGTNGQIRHEMAIEADLVEKLTKKENERIFGTWDYISHQVVASPFKPIDYMYKMDIFAYHYLKIGNYSVKDKYLIVEIKKGPANEETLHQIMKYVDWVSAEYTHGDVSMIQACIVASDFLEDLIEKSKRICIRNYSIGFNPTHVGIWNNISFVKYKYKEDTNEIIYQKLE